jgi:uroporphyrinogen-III synthase
MTRIVVTRPEPDNARLCEALAAKGYEPIALPLIEIEPLAQTPERRRLIEDLDLFDVVICTSAHAARLAAAWIDRIWLELPLEPAWYAVGARTAGVLGDYGIDAISPGLQSSEGLLDLRALGSVSNRRCLILKGEGGRPFLADSLIERGALVDVLDLYRRVPLHPDAIAGGFGAECAEYAVVTSVELLEALAKIIPAGVHAPLVLIVPSERVAQVAREHGYCPSVAAGASVEATLAQVDEAEKGRYE